MSRIILITGGARSGKSTFALKKANELPGRKVYIATAEPLDEEMKERIDRHKKERGREWLTIEEPFKISGLLRQLKGRYDVLLLDCLTLWLSNMMHLNKEELLTYEVEEFIKALRDFKYDGRDHIFEGQSPSNSLNNESSIFNMGFGALPQSFEGQSPSNSLNNESSIFNMGFGALPQSFEGQSPSNSLNTERQSDNIVRSGALPQRTETLFIVSNEVGMGIVPENELARRFRDQAGILNQQVAGIADEVYLVISGIPLRIKD